jgi:excinuclease ABC subunit A
MQEQIIIRGARQHNLKNVDVAIPRDRFIVITGVSGSGKSSLAFDTLFAEGQRRYVEALSADARQFLRRIEAPRVDEIQGLSPAIAIEQKGMVANPRSTVGTLTEIYDYLRLLFARLGMVYCPWCNLQVRAYSVPEMVREMLEDWPEGSRMLILAPLAPVKEKDLARVLKKLRIDGYARIRLEDNVYELDPPPRIPRRPEYKLDIVVDRLILDSGKTQRLRDSLELASRVGLGMSAVKRLEGGEKSFSEILRCISCGRVFPEPTPSLFSFHHPSGACSLCNGLGTVEESRPDTSGKSRTTRRTPHETEPRKAKSRFNLAQACQSCGGSRLNEFARSVRIEDKGIHEIAGLPVRALITWLTSLKLTPTEEQIADRPRQEAVRRLKTMEELGLAYLTQDRSAITLSGGESQRIRLVSQISSPLSGILYVLDEPSIGLHARDHQRLLEILFRLRDAGNTVVVVEHDRETILRADYVVDMGPGAGINGGELIFSGTPRDLLSHKTSLTAQYLSGRRQINIPERRRGFEEGMLELTGARGHNLKDITVQIPLGAITCVTGVSGSGKSTLVMHTLYKALAMRLYGSRSEPAPFDRLLGSESLGKVILVDQTPLGRTPRSTPATYTAVFSLIRRLFSQLPEARARGWGSNRFSFNTKGGRCEVCQGEGLQKIEMFFLPDIYVTCAACRGTRYREDTLEIRLKGRSIAEILDMTVHEAAAFFENIPAISARLSVLQEVGLGYLRLGQPATTLSGGEAQRVKLAAELGRRAAGRAVYILDEPTTGLHFDDIEKLLHVLQRLADAGHTIIMIEHHPDVVKSADYVVDLGPEGGEEGGYVVAAGTPEEIARVEQSHTGRCLREALNTRPSSTG